MDAFAQLGVDRQRGHKDSDDDGDTPSVLALVVPDSAAAPPLRITIDTGPFQLAHNAGGSSVGRRTWSWGVRAALEASTLHTLMDPNPSDEETGRWANVCASFRTTLALPYAACGNVGDNRCGGGGDCVAREPNGAVLITASKRRMNVQ